MTESICRIKSSLLLMCLFTIYANSSTAQSISYNPIRTTVYASPVDALASRLFAQSEYLRASGGRNCFRCRNEVIVDDGAVFEALACFLPAKSFRFVCDSHANHRRATRDTREDCQTVDDEV